MRRAIVRRCRMLINPYIYRQRGAANIAHAGYSISYLVNCC
jgi:hypothetical protein